MFGIYLTGARFFLVKVRPETDLWERIVLKISGEFRGVARQTIAHRVPAFRRIPGSTPSVELLAVWIQVVSRQ